MFNRLGLLRKFVLGLLVIFIALGLSTPIKAQEMPKIYFFYGTGCPHCAQVLEYFEKGDLFNKYPVEKREIYFDRNNAFLFNEMLNNLGVEENSRGVPTAIIGKKILVGDKLIIDNFVSEADKFLSTNNTPENTSSYCWRCYAGYGSGYFDGLDLVWVIKT